MQPRAIDQLYIRQRRAPDAMAQHMDVIRDLAAECESCAEIGIRRGSSTIALLAGCPGTVTSFDIERYPHHEAILKATDLGRWRPHYMPSETASAFDVDMMVIDGFHNYPQVKMELDLFADHVAKYLVFHDTISCGTVGDGIANPKVHQAPHLSDKRGIRMAIDELMIRDPSWLIKAHYPNDSGLLILERRP
jgi:hypothetical protein